VSLLNSNSQRPRLNEVGNGSDCWNECCQYKRCQNHGLALRTLCGHSYLGGVLGTGSGGGGISVCLRIAACFLNSNGSGCVGGATAYDSNRSSRLETSVCHRVTSERLAPSRNDLALSTLHQAIMAATSPFITLDEAPPPVLPDNRYFRMSRRLVPGGIGDGLGWLGVSINHLSGSELKSAERPLDPPVGGRVVTFKGNRK